ncbi:unnamed protein product [Rotaria sp. Silwood1]|nr:unnamed protein product [Rotaria sp. Silwood1]
MNNLGRRNKPLSSTPMSMGQDKKPSTMVLNLDKVSIREDEHLLVNEIQKEVPMKYQLKSLEEPALSQRLNQLSVTSHHTPEHLISVHEDDAENIPYYLSKESESFQKMTGNLSSNELVEKLRQMAIVIHELFMIDLQKSLWTIYLKSGTGQLQLNQMDHDQLSHPHLWPIEVQKLMRQQSLDSTDMAACLTYVTQHLDELDDKMKQCQTKYNMMKNQYFNYVPKIQTFVHQQLESARLATEQQIAIVHYNYNDHLFELKFMAYNPTPQQKQTVETLNHAKYQEQITTQELNLLKYRISIQESSPTSLRIPNEKLLKRIKNQSIRQKLYDQYINIAQQAKKDMIQLCLSTAQAQMDRYHNEFNTKLKQFKLQEQSEENDKKFSSNMIHFIEQHWTNISEGVQRFYKYKHDFVRLNSVHD